MKCGIEKKQRDIVETRQRGSQIGTEQQTQDWTGVLREHMDMAFTLQNKCGKMGNAEIREKEIKNCLNELRKGKVAGPDRVESE